MRLNDTARSRVGNGARTRDLPQSGFIRITESANAMMIHRHGPSWLLLPAFCFLIFSPGCVVGPRYHRPSAPVPAAYKEKPPENTQATATWKQAQPSDTTSKGNWWEIFNDPELNKLEEQVSLSNQNILAAEAQYRAASEAVRVVRSGLFPAATVSPSIINSRAAVTGTAGVQGFTPSSRTTYDFPGDLNWEADLWGSIRHSVRGSAATAQSLAAQVQNARLSFQAELAQDYFELRGTDSSLDLLARTVKSYEEYLHLTKDRFKAGVASGADVAQAETQLDTARAQLTDLEVSRDQFEHAIAILTGKPPAAVSVSSATLKAQPPAIPVGVPSQLLERRPDVAALEREMASSNELIGVAQAAYFPTLTLSATGGVESSDFLKWISWPSRFWSAGPQMAETVFDAGRRRAQVAQAKDTFDATVANYRQAVLVSFQQVEDNLSALRVLENEARVEDEAVQAAESSLTISTAQYKAGTTSYLQVVTEQAAYLDAQRSAIDILTRRMTSSVFLIEALGGGWDASALPTEHDLAHAR